MSISERQLKKRYKINNSDLLRAYFDKNQSVLCLTGHYGNWEYGILATGNVFLHETIALYLPLTNRYTEYYGVKRRERFGTKMLSIRETKNLFAASQIPKAIILAADQSPSNKEKMIWTTFLNQHTACLHGPEVYAHKTNFPLVYFKIEKPKRGFYTLTVEKFIEQPSEYQAHKITELYMQKIETDIKFQPEFWLWSHKRWKQTKTHTE
jgi:KDO2-lipid IV(A) lauroyltransferase